MQSRKIARAGLAAGWCLALAAAPGVRAESLSERLAKASGAVALAPVEVACGRLDKANCAQVLPRVAEQAMQAGLSLRPAESQGSVESAQGVCQGLVPAAIVQRDAADAQARKPECMGRFDVVGKPVYPYYGFLVVAASRPEGGLQEMVANTPQGKNLKISAGGAGSGGQVTMDYMLRANAAWKRVITLAGASADTALVLVKDGALDGLFVMEAPNSPLLETIRTAVDAKGKALFKFVDIRPGDAFYGIKDWGGRPMFQQQTLVSGWFGDTKVPSVDAVFIADNAFREDRAKGGPQSVAKLSEAIDRAQAAVFAETNTPRDWQPASARR